MFRDEETLYHSVLIWHRSELFYTECKPGLSLAEGREGKGREGKGRGRGGESSLVQDGPRGQHKVHHKPYLIL